MSIAELIRARATESADRPAILGADGGVLTYAGLSDRLDHWHAALAALGLDRSARIGLCLPAGPELAVALLAVSAHAACAPLSPDSPDVGLARDRAELSLDLLVTTPPRAGALRELGVPATAVDLDVSPPAAPEPLRPHDIALLLRTSGTTGQPKVVPLSHANLRVAADNVRRSLALTPEDRCLNIMPLWHVHGFVAGLLASLAAGASVLCAPPFAAAEFPVLLHRSAATWYTAAPALHKAIVETMRERPAHPHRLRFVRSCSARLPSALAADLEATFGVPALEAYGMTEAAHQIAVSPLPPAARKRGSVGIGTGVRIAILGPDATPLGAGAEGEIVIRDGGVFAGYESDPANGEAFVDGWFRTGDLGRLDADGYLFLTGRIREMINRGGQTIAPREIDEVLLDHPEVADAVALGIPHPRLGEVVAAVVAPRPGCAPTEAELRAFARIHLAPAKVPARIAVIAEIPRGASGKPRPAELRRVLAARPDPVGPSGPADSAEPDTGATRLAPRIAAEWATLLETDAVSLTDSLSLLGSDSLLCTRMANRIEAAFGVRIPMDELLLADTVAEQSVLVGDLLAARPSEPA